MKTQTNTDEGANMTTPIRISFEGKAGTLFQDFDKSSFDKPKLWKKGFTDEDEDYYAEVRGHHVTLLNACVKVYKTGENGARKWRAVARTMAGEGEGYGASRNAAGLAALRAHAAPKPPPQDDAAPQDEAPSKSEAAPAEPAAAPAEPPASVKLYSATARKVVTFEPSSIRQWRNWNAADIIYAAHAVAVDALATVTLCAAKGECGDWHVTAEVTGGRGVGVGHTRNRAGWLALVDLSSKMEVRDVTDAEDGYEEVEYAEEPPKEEPPTTPPALYPNGPRMYKTYFYDEGADTHLEVTDAGPGMATVVKMRGRKVVSTDEVPGYKVATMLRGMLTPIVITLEDDTSKSRVRHGRVTRLLSPVDGNHFRAEVCSAVSTYVRHFYSYSDAANFIKEYQDGERERLEVRGKYGYGPGYISGVSVDGVPEEVSRVAGGPLEVYKVSYPYGDFYYLVRLPSPVWGEPEGAYLIFGAPVDDVYSNARKRVIERASPLVTRADVLNESDGLGFAYCGYALFMKDARRKCREYAGYHMDEDDLAYEVR